MTGSTESGERARRVGAVVVVHGCNRYLPDCLDALGRQCDTVVVVDNVPDAQTAALVAERDVVVHRNARPASFAHNVNAGVGLLDTDYVAVVNPDAVADDGCVRRLVEFLDSEPSVSIAAPQLRWPDGTPQPTGRSFPTVGATVLRRTPLRRLWRPTELQRRHYRLDNADATTPWHSDWLLGAFWVMERDVFHAVGGMDVGYRMYVEDMDLCARLAADGHGRCVVPAATAVHEYQAVIDRRFLTRRNWWHLRGMARFVRRHPARVLRSHQPRRAA